jgi:hypothetical protein
VYDEAGNARAHWRFQRASGDFADSLAVFAAPKRIGLKSYMRLFGIAGKIILDYVIRRLNALSVRF